LLSKNLKITKYRTKILPVVGRIFGPKRDEVTRERRKLHNEELTGLYSSPNIIWVIKPRRMRWTGHVVRSWERRVVYRVLVGMPKGKRPLGRNMRRWEDDIRMDLQEIGCGSVDWFDLPQDSDRCWAFVIVVMNLHVL